MAASGLIRAALAALVAVSVGCGGSSPPRNPTAPSTPVPTAPLELTVWTGAFDITSCTGGDPMFDCLLRPERFALRLRADGAGVLQIDSDGADARVSIPVDVTARSGGGSPTVLTGSSPAGMNLHVELSLTATSPALAGTVQYSVESALGRTISKEGRILFSRRPERAPFGRLQGVWEGFAERTECAGDCGDFAVDPVVNVSPNRRFGSVRLDVSQNGSAIVGSVNGFGISGTTAGDSLVATGRRATPENCPGWISDHVDAEICLIEATIEARADRFDRLRGSITYRVQGVARGNQPYAFTARGELSAIARWP